MSRTSRSLASRAARTPTEPEKKPLAGFYDDCAVLAMPVSDRDAKRAAEERRQERRSMAVAVCDKAIRDGCEGAGCTSPEHGEHVWQVLEDLRELELAEDPKAGGEG